MESTENHNFLSSLIKQPKNYPWTYSDTFSQIPSVKNNSNFIFLQFCVFVCAPIPKNENAEFAEGFKKFQKFTESVLDSGCSAQIGHLLPMFIYTADYFSNLLLPIWTFFQTKNWKMDLRLAKWNQIIAHDRNRAYLSIQVNFEALCLTLMKCKLEYEMFWKLSTNSAFSFLILYLKTKTQNPWKDL